MMAAINKDVVLGVSLVLSVVSLVLLFGATWYFQSSLDLLQQQAEYDRELLFKLQEQISVCFTLYSSDITIATYIEHNSNNFLHIITIIKLAIQAVILT